MMLHLIIPRGMRDPATPTFTAVFQPGVAGTRDIVDIDDPQAILSFFLASVSALIAILLLLSQHR